MSSTIATAQGAEFGPLSAWQKLFRTLGLLGVIAMAIWLVVAASLFEDASPFASISYGYQAEARVEFYGALFWAFVALCSAVTNFFFAALMQAGDECIRLLRRIAAGERGGSAA